MTDTDYDAIYISNSPGMMMEAHLAAHQGQKVCIIDRRADIGGAWYTNQIFAQNHIERGPHFFQSQPPIAFFKKLYDFDFVPTPRPQWGIKFRGRHFLTSDWIGKLLVTTKQLLSGLFRNTRQMIMAKHDDRYSNLRALAKGLYLHLFHYKEAQVYLNQGCHHFNQSIYDKAVASGVTFIHGDVTSVTTHSDHVLCSFGQDKTITAKTLYMTERTCIPHAYDSQKTRHDLKIIGAIRHQLHMIVKTEQPMDFFLYRFLGHPFFAITNLSTIQNGTMKDHHFMLSITFSNFSPGADKQFKDANDVLDYLKHYKLVPDDCIITDHEYSDYQDDRMHPQSYKTLTTAPFHHIEKIGDIDLSIWMKQIEKKWSNIS